MYNQPSNVVAFHSCDKDVGLKVLNGNEHLKPSINSWDWLGNGIYFWEHNPQRALQYAKEVSQKIQFAKANIKVPFVIGAVIDLRYCLNLVKSSNLEILKEAYKYLKASYINSKTKLPKNEGSSRKLDCAVIKALHKSNDENNLKSFDSIRGAFPEGRPVYKGCSIKERTHLQICVRNIDYIQGYFLPQPVKI